MPISSNSRYLRISIFSFNFKVVNGGNPYLAHRDKAKLLFLCMSRLQFELKVLEQNLITYNVITVMLPSKLLQN